MQFRYPPPRCVKCGSEELESASTDPLIFKCYGVRPNSDWPAILALHRHALYSELELIELFNIYKQKGSEADKKEFIESRFVKHPFFSDTKYMWRGDYEKAMQRVNSQQGATGIPIANLADKKSKTA